MKMIRWMLYGFVAMLLVAKPIHTSANNDFADVKKTDESYEEIHYIANLGIISGYTENGKKLYKPQNNITRAQASKMLVVATNNEGHDGSHIKPKDMTPGSEQHYYVSKAVSLGFFKLNADGTFKPNEDVKRAELAVALATAFDIVQPVTLNHPLHFYDLSRTHPNAAHINGLYYAGLSRGDRGAFGPDRLLTRKHFALFVARSMEEKFKLSTSHTSKPVIGKGRITTPTLNVRSAPSVTNGTLVGTLKKGDTFEVIGERDNWLEIKYFNQPAFISNSTNYLDLLDADNKPLGSVTSYVKVKTGDDTLNVRTLPSVNGTIIGTFKNGETIEVYGQKNGWLLTLINGLPGYVNAHYTEDVNESTPSSPDKLLGKVTVASLNMRSGPGNQYPIVGALKRNQKVEVTSLDGYWATINYNGKTTYVHKSYLKLLNQSASPVKDRIIVLDAGHGGSDPGASGNGIIEKNLTLDISKRVEAKLKSAGAKVLMTRSGDTFPSLRARTEFAKANYAETFVSIHGNSFTPSANGAEVFYDTSGNPNGNESRELARYIQNNLVKMANMTDRGIKDTGFYVIKNNNVASVLVELGFMTNASDAEKLKKNPDIFAEAVYRGILEYYAAG